MSEIIAVEYMACKFGTETHPRVFHRFADGSDVCLDITEYGDWAFDYKQPLRCLAKAKELALLEAAKVGLGAANVREYTGHQKPA